MRAPRRHRPAAVLVGAVLVLTGCADDDRADAEAAAARDRAKLVADCSAAVDQLATTTQRYLDSVEASSAAPASAAAASQEPVPDAAEQEQQFSQALSNLQAYAGSLGCDPGQFRTDLGAALRELDAGGPVSTAVLRQLQADSGQRTSSTVPPGGDVAGAVASAEPGAVVTLEAGEHVVDETLVLLRGVTLQGAGRDTTTLRSAAPGGVVLVLTGEPVALTGMTLTRSGEGAGSVVSAAPVATLEVDDARVSGARAGAEGAGGIGVLMAAGSGQGGPTRRTSLRFTDSEAVDNAVAGIAVSGEHRAEVVRAVLDRNGQCGVCFLDTSDGTVSDSSLTGNGAGVVVTGDAKPLLSATTVDGGEVGVQAIDRAAPVVEGSTVVRSARAGLLFAGSARGAVRATSCSEVPFGIVVGPAAAPEVGDNPGCELARGQE